MEKSHIIIGAIVICILFLLSGLSRSIEDSLIKGFWKADAAFCSVAELEMFILYIGDNTSLLGNVRNCYFLAANSDGVILNNPAEISFGYCLNIMPGISTNKNYSVSIDWTDGPPEDPNAFPTDCDVVYYPKYGKLIFYSSDTILVTLWRDNQMTAMTSDVLLIPESVKHLDDNAPAL